MAENTDVHIAAAVAKRREWEGLRDALIEESRRRHSADITARDELESQAKAVRLEVTGRLGRLLETLEPYVDGTMGEVTVGLAAVYVKALHELAALYRVAGPQRPLTARLAVPEPPEVVDPVAQEAVMVEAAVGRREEVLRKLAARAQVLELEAG